MSKDLGIEPYGWSFQVEEVSAGVYQVTGTDRAGRRVTLTGTEPEEVLEECKRNAMRISQAAKPR